MLKQVVSQIKSADWFVTIDLKDVYFHISILPTHREFLRFAFGGKAYQYRVLPFSLALSPRTFTKCVDAALAPLRLQGIRILNYTDDWLILAQSEQMVAQHRDVVLAHMKVLGLRLNAKKSVLSPALRTTYLGVVWDSTTMQARTSPAQIESILTAVARVRGGQSLTVKRVQRPLGLMAAASNVIPLGLLYMRPLQGWLKTRVFFPEGKPASHDQGHAAVPMCLRHVETTLVLVSGPGAGSSLSPRNASDGRVPHRLGSRHPVEAGAEARGMDASPQGGEADLESVWPGTGGPLRYSGDSAMSSLVLSNSPSSTGAGCCGTDVAEASSVHFSPDRSAPGSSGESAPGRGQSTSGSTVLAGPSMVLRPDFSPQRLSMGDSRQERSPLTSGGLSPPPGDVEVLGVAPVGAQLIASGLSTEVVETILQSRAPSARKLYALKWKLSLHGAETASSTQSTARLVQFWSSCRPDFLQGWPTPPWRFTWRQFGLQHLSWWALSG